MCEWKKSLKHALNIGLITELGYKNGMEKL